MRANELMVGDWVQKLEVGGHYRKCRIKAIIDNNVDCETSDGEVHTLSVNGIEPITLTAEILKKNGWIVWKANKMGVVIFTQYFEFSDSLLGIEDSIESRIDCDPYGDFHYMCNGKSFCYINSVHELQHVLPLLGIEKEIEL